MAEQTWAVVQDEATGTIHAMPYFQLSQHKVATPCPCNPVVEIYSERNGGQRIYRHNAFEVDKS